MQAKTVVGLVYGGKSSEHEVSLLTAFSVMEAVDYEEMEIIPIYIDLDGDWSCGKRYSQKPSTKEEIRFAKQSEPVHLFKLKEEVDVFFPVIHGPYGEDGTLQGLLEMLAVPYVGCGVFASSAAMDKVMMKHLFANAGLKQCNYQACSRQAAANPSEELLTSIETELGYPCFVKPANLGSSVGISKAKNRQELITALQLAAKFDHKVIIEAFVQGREVEIGVLGNQQLQTSVVGEIIPSAEFYDYEAKYKSDSTKLVIPAKVPASVVDRMEEMAKRAFFCLECSGLSRVDFFWDEQADEVYINEINTMPGFTPFSMYPMLFQAAGIAYPALIKQLVQLSLERFEEKKQNQISAESLD